MAFSCSFDTNGDPYCLQLLSPELQPEHLAFSLQPAARLILADRSLPVELTRIEVKFSTPTQVVDADGDRMTAIGFVGQCLVEAGPEHHVLPPDAQLDVDLLIHTVDGQLLPENEAWEFVESTTLQLS